MKKTVAFLFLLFSAITTFGQFFEGEIIYANTFVSKTDKTKSAQFATALGDRQNYYIKGGLYKSLSNGNVLQWQIYNNKENRLYSKLINSGSAYWNDGSVQGDKVLNAVINKNVTEVLGYKCDELILTCKSGVQKYYFSSKLAVNAKLYVQHKFGNWYDYVSRANAIPLKTIIENSQFTLVSTATSVKPSKLNDNVFEIPAGMHTEKFPY